MYADIDHDSVGYGSEHFEGKHFGSLRVSQS